MKIVGGLGLFAVALLAGCGQEADDIRLQEITCPAVAVPAYGRDLVQWQGDGHDLTNLAYRVRIADAEGSCTQSNRTLNLSTRILVILQATRGPALAGRTITADYFVAVMRQGRIIDKQDYELTGVFPPNTDQLTLPGQPVKMNLPISQQIDGSAYTIEVGMQLTPDQLSDNVTSSRR